jgi:trans-aconitate methyltransferase
LATKNKMTFDLVAPVYDALARLVFGRTLQRAQTALLGSVSLPNNGAVSILIVGGGTGFLLVDVLNRFPGCRVLYLEASGAMNRRTTRRLLRKPTPGAVPGTVDFRTGNETALGPGEQFDLILLPFILDLFTETTLNTKLLPRLLAATAPGGQWLVTDFVNSPVRYHRALLWVMFRFFRLAACIEARQLPDWQRLLTEAEFRQDGKTTQLNGLVMSVLLRQLPK